MTSPMDISASALYAQRTRMNVIANNIANVNTTRDAYGRVNPYRRREVIFQSLIECGKKLQGVEVPKIVEDPSPFKKVHDPTHPDADAHGYVLFPNVNLIVEFVNMIDATRAYEANVTAMNATKTMVSTSLRILA